MVCVVTFINFLQLQTYITTNWDIAENAQLEPSFYAESDSFYNSYQWRSSLFPL